MVNLSTFDGASHFINLLKEHAPDKVEDLDLVISGRETAPVKWLEQWKATIASDPSELQWLRNLRNRLLTSSNAAKDSHMPPEITSKQLKSLESAHFPEDDHSALFEAGSEDIRKYLNLIIESADVSSLVAFTQDSIDDEERIDPSPESIQVLPLPGSSTTDREHKFTSGADDLSNEWNCQCERFEEVVRNNRDLFFPGRDVLGLEDVSSGKEAVVVGRIVSEDVHQHLTQYTMLLEGNRNYSNGKIVTLNIDKLASDRKYYLYPGKMVACLGICTKQSDSDSLMTFQAYDMISGLRPVCRAPRPLECLKPGTTIDFCVLGGPFIRSDGRQYDFRRLEKACRQISLIKPSLVVIMGPILPTGHPITAQCTGLLAEGKGFKDSAISFTDIYTSTIDYITSKLPDNGIRTIIIPHANDILFPGPLPQLPIDNQLGLPQGDHPLLEYGTNPCYLNINGMGCTIIGQDILKDLAPRNVKGQAFTNEKKKLKQLADEIVEQGSLLCGVMQSTIGAMVDAHTVRCLTIGQEICQDSMDPSLIIHSSSHRKLPAKFIPMAHDRAIGSAYESLLHFRLKPIATLDQKMFIDEFKNPGRIDISIHAWGSLV